MPHLYNTNRITRLPSKLVERPLHLSRPSQIKFENNPFEFLTMKFIDSFTLHKGRLSHLIILCEIPEIQLIPTLVKPQNSHRGGKYDDIVAVSSLDKRVHVHVHSYPSDLSTFTDLKPNVLSPRKLHRDFALRSMQVADCTHYTHECASCTCIKTARERINKTINSSFITPENL